MGHVQKTWMTIAGWVLTAFIALGMTFSAVMKFQFPAEMATEWVNKMGYPAHLSKAIGTVELVCLVFFVFPKTAVLGAILLTGYLGGAIATHVRIEDAFISPVIGGVLVWLALYLRDARIRALIPLRKSALV